MCSSGIFYLPSQANLFLFLFVFRAMKFTFGFDAVKKISRSDNRSFYAIEWGRLTTCSYIGRMQWPG